MKKSRKKSGHRHPGKTGRFLQSSVAAIYLDNMRRGETPNTISNMQVGSYTVLLVKEGYQEYQESGSVTGGGTWTINKNLDSHTLTVTSPGQNSTWIKGAPVSITWTSDTSSVSTNKAFMTPGLNLNVNPGNHRIQKFSSPQTTSSMR